jgi:hypothetical protein
VLRSGVLFVLPAQAALRRTVLFVLPEQTVLRGSVLFAFRFMKRRAGSHCVGGGIFGLLRAGGLKGYKEDKRDYDVSSCDVIIVRLNMKPLRYNDGNARLVPPSVCRMCGLRKARRFGGYCSLPSFTNVTACSLCNSV